MTENKKYLGVSGRERDYSYRCIHKLISEQAEKQKSRIAVVDYDRTISYGSLEKISDEIAYSLQNAGVQKGDPVVTISGRSIELIVTAVAILKCGACYVPIDEAYPEERMISIISDIGTGVIINLSRKQFKLTNNSKVKIFTYDKISTLDCIDMHYRINDCNEEAVAYVIYTSGTTGKPKGVMVSHKAISNTLYWMNDQFRLEEDDIIAFKTSISFTDSIWEIFWPLINGATITIISSNDEKDPRKLYECMLKKRVSYTQFVPSMMKLFLEYINFRDLKNPLPDLKWVFNGGEQIGINLARKFNDYFFNAKIANIYGMTESAIYATCHIVEKKLNSKITSVAIGKPIANTRIFLLNSEDYICTPYEKGEICIGGVSLADGYWNDIELTAEKFIQKPWHTGIIYRTGDIGWIDRDGCIWYTGRKDNQVKVRGNRVEIYEIERNILEYEGIQQTAVVAVANRYGENILMCYLENDSVNTAELREYLREKLPEYMVPQKYIFIDNFPLTVNNKIDRSRLIRWERDKIVRTDDKKSPENEQDYKEMIRKIWSYILETDEFGDEQDFYDVGGDSLALGRLQIELEKHNILIDYNRLLMNRTIDKIISIAMDSNNRSRKKDIYK
jgi:amino acid adenylation domain-containing protein